MTGLVAAKMRDLADALADLKVRLRVALAGELAQHVAQAVGDVVRSLVAGRAELAVHRPSSRPWDKRDPWDEQDDDDPDEREADDETQTTTLPASAAAPVAIAAAVHIVRWWLGRKGHLLGAIGIGLGVGVLGLTGGTLVRSALAALIAAADLIAVTDTLDDSSARLQPV